MEMRQLQKLNGDLSRTSQNQDLVFGFLDSDTEFSQPSQMWADTREMTPPLNTQESVYKQA